jgi:anaerobic selenocysteine-containing dehydrogenase
MQRRDFIKISAVTGAVAALEACKNPDHQLIRFIPEEDLIPGVAAWKPSICTLCPAGCGLLVRVMQGDAEVMRNGKRGILTMGLAKKLEGNPAHPINQGRLCPRGQAGLQVTYHPDRVQHPLLRTGERGSGQFQEISWDEALKRIVSELRPLQGQSAPLAFLTNRLSGQREEIVYRFASAFPGSTISEFALFDDSVMREANLRSFGYAVPPTLDLSRSKYVLSFGADFLGTWNSPVSQSIGYGQMRQGHPGQRAKLVHFESRLSLTAANADECIASPPGAEGALALALAHVILRDKLRAADAAGRAGSQIDGWSTGLGSYTPEEIEKQFGVPAATITRIAHEAAANEPAVALIGDAATSQTNGLFNALAVNALNELLDNIGKPGGTLFTPEWTPQFAKARSHEGNSNRTLPMQALASRILSGTVAPKALFVYNANPVFATPVDWKVREAMKKAPFVVSLGSFIDETSIFADLILPDHSPLESWLDDSPAVGATDAVVSLAPPAMHPLHNTRAMPDVLLDIAHRLGGDLGLVMPWKSYEEMLQAAFAELYKERGAESAQNADVFWKRAQEQGGWWSSGAGSAPAGPSKNTAASTPGVLAQFDGSPERYPFHLLPFASQMHYDGSLAHLPWAQEAPDPLSTVMWGTWLEVNPKTAAALGLEQGDLVQVESQHGTLQAPAFVTPGIAPDVVAMPVGQGHEHFTRYAKGRGANPISILAPMQVSGADSFAWAATRVRVSRIGKSNMIVFGGNLTEMPPELEHR